MNTKRITIAFATAIGLLMFQAQAIPRIAFGRLTDSGIDTEKATVTFKDETSIQTMQFNAFDFYSAYRMASSGNVPLEPLWSMPDVDESVKKISKKVHLYFNGWESGGHVYGGWELVAPGTRSMTAEWLEIKTNCYYYSIGATALLRMAGAYETKGWTEHDVGTGATLFLPPKEIKINPETGYAEETYFRLGDPISDTAKFKMMSGFGTDGGGDEMAVWLSCGVGCFKEQCVTTDPDDLEWMSWEAETPGSCTFDVQLHLTTGSGKEQRTYIGSVTIPKYAFRGGWDANSTAAGFYLRYTIPRSFFTPGEKYYFTFEFNRGRSAPATEYPTGVARIEIQDYDYTNGGLDLKAESADPAAGSLTLSWKHPDWSFAGISPDEVASKASYSVWRSRGDLDDQERYYLLNCLTNMTCIAPNVVGTSFTDHDFHKVGGTGNIHYYVILNGSPDDSRYDLPVKVPYLQKARRELLSTRDRHYISCGLHEYSGEYNKMAHAHDKLEAESFANLINAGRFHSAPIQGPDSILRGSECTLEALEDAFYNMAESVYVKPGEGYLSVKPGDDVFFFIATHGNPGNLMLYDDHLSKETLCDYVRLFKDKGVRFIGVINACHSGAFVELFNTAEFGYTAWVAAAEEHMIACCFKNVSGFGKTFIEWGWLDGHARRESVFSRYMRDGPVGGEGDFISVKDLASYADLIYPGHSPTINLAGEFAPERYEQHVVTVNEKMLAETHVKKIAIKDVPKVDVSAPTITVNDHSELNLAGISAHGIDVGEIMRMQYGESKNDWHTYMYTNTMFYTIYSPLQYRLICRKIMTSDLGGVCSYFDPILDIIHPVANSGTYKVSVRRMTGAGWSEKSNEIELSVMDDKSWVLAAFKDGKLDATANGVVSQLGDFMELRLTMEDAKQALIGLSGKYWYVDEFIAEHPYYFGTVLGDVKFNDKKGSDVVATVDCGEVTAEMVHRETGARKMLTGKLTATITPQGMTAKFGGIEFSGPINLTDAAAKEALKGFGDWESPTLPPAEWEGTTQKVCTVTFEPGDAFIETPVRRVLSGSSIGALETPFRASGDFRGWFDAPADGNMITEETLVESNVTYYAQWDNLTYGTVQIEDGEAYVSVYADSPSNGYTTGGNDSYKPGTVITLKAFPRGASIFGGWYNGSGELLSREATFKFTVPDVDVDVVAYFVSSDMDSESLAINMSGEYAYTNAGPFKVEVESFSAPVVSVSGLPAGLRFDNDTLSISGVPKEPGSYEVSVSATNASRKQPVTAVFTLVVLYYAESIFSAAGLETNEPYVLHAGAAPDLSNVFKVVAAGGWTLAISGLPPGVKYNSKNGELTGIATTEGTYSVTFAATKKGEDKQSATVTFTVVFPTLGIEKAAWNDVNAMNNANVKGAGRYPVGKNVTLKATPAKGCVFAGWWRVEGNVPWQEGELLSSAASFSHVMTAEDMMLTAVFATAAEDAESLKVTVEDMMTEVDGTIGTLGTDGGRAFDLGACVTSLSLPKLAVSGLPTGLKFDAKTNKILGRTTKPGVYTVTVKATNASVTKATDATTATFKLTVPNFMCAALPDLLADTDAYGTVRVGVAFGIDCTAEEGWSVKVAGLPAGLKYDAKTGKITGIPTAKPGAYTVTFTASKKGEKNQIATITLNIEALPDWAVGTFTGYVEPGDYGLATMTVAANGKISGKIQHGGTNWTFKADSYADIECRPSDVDEGIETNYVIQAVATAGKVKRTLVLRVANMQNVSSAGNDGQVATVPPGMINAKVDGATEDGMQTFSLWRTIWKDKATAGVAKTTLAEWEGTYNVSFEPSENSGYGSGYLSLAVGKDGNVKATGKLADGTSLSASSPLMYDGEHGYFVLVYAAPSAYMGGSFALSISFDGPKGELGNSVDVSKWSNRNPQATGVYGEGFARWVSFFGSYYDKNVSLTNFYDRLTFALAELPPLAASCKHTYFDENDRKVTETQQGEAAPVYLLGQDGLTVSVNTKGTGFDVLKATKPVQDKGTKLWNYPGPNDGGLTLTFDQKTGVFKGTYTFWYDYLSVNDEISGKETWMHTSQKVSFEGLMVQGEGPRGFYLREESSSYEDPKTGKPKAYKYKSSHSIHFTSPDSGWHQLNNEGEWRTNVSVKRGDSHVFWVDCLSPETGVAGIYVEGSYTYTKDGEVYEELVNVFEGGEIFDKDGNIAGFFMTLTTNDWFVDEYTPKYVRFKVIVDGSYDENNVASRKFKFHHLRGEGVFP